MRKNLSGLKIINFFNRQRVGNLDLLRYQLQTERDKCATLEERLTVSDQMKGGQHEVQTIICYRGQFALSGSYCKYECGTLIIYNDSVDMRLFLRTSYYHYK